VRIDNLVIISPAQNVVERACLDWAVECGLPHGGWIPSDGETNLNLPRSFQIHGVLNGNASEVTDRNILESDGALILFYDNQEKERESILQRVENLGQPFSAASTAKGNRFHAAREAAEWLQSRNIWRLCVTGPPSGKAKEQVESVHVFLKTMYHMLLVCTEMPDPSVRVPEWPQTVGDAVERLNRAMPLKDRHIIAYLEEENLETLLPTLGGYIMNRFGLESGNNPRLLEDCRRLERDGTLDVKGAVMTIMTRLRYRLEKEVRLRVVSP
jgi:hypothetical protein